MPSLMTLARAAEEVLPRRLIAAAANAVLSIRRGDPRRFAVTADGLWINRGPEATFVSPDIYTAHLAQVTADTIDHWCADYVPKPGDTVVDVGAGIGEEAVVLSRLVGPEGRVIAIEAHPRTFACLQQTVARSGLANVTAVQRAIAERPGTLRIGDTDQHLANSVIESGGNIEVEAITLDDLLASEQVRSVALLKMNIEGAEKPAMEGMRASAAIIRNVAISCHDFVADAGGGEQFRTRDAVERSLHNLGYVTRTNPDAAHPWLRDTLFGRKP